MLEEFSFCYLYNTSSSVCLVIATLPGRTGGRKISLVWSRNAARIEIKYIWPGKRLFCTEVSQTEFTLVTQSSTCLIITQGCGADCTISTYLSSTIKFTDIQKSTINSLDSCKVRRVQ